MNHTPHILASVFLCGLWLPVWILTAITYQDVWRCAFCGYGDAVKYLANPMLRQQEQIAAHNKRLEDQKRQEEKEQRLALMPTDTNSAKLAYVWSAHKVLILVAGSVALLLGIIIVATLINRPTGSNLKDQSRSEGGVQPTSSRKSDLKPIFDASKLAGKNPTDIQKILGSPTESWTPRTGNNNLMQSYALGEEMTVEFIDNKIDSFVIFFDQNNVDSGTAHRLVGLNSSSANPKGILKTNTGENWIKVFYSRSITNNGDSLANSSKTVGPEQLVRKALVISENANFRLTPDSGGGVLRTVPYGEEVEVVKQKGPWFEIKYLGESGWVHGNTIRLLP